MTARRRSAVALAIVATCAAGAACGSGKSKTKYEDSYFDILIVADGTCDPLQPVCVSALETHLTHDGAEVVLACTDVVPILGAPAQSIQALNSLTGVEIAENFPTDGLVGVEFRGYLPDCAQLAKTVATPNPVFAGYAEVQLSNDDQQLLVPVGCDQPQLPCEPEPTPTPCLACGI